MRPISTKAHTIIGLGGGVVLLLAPYIFNFASVSSATLAAQVIGLFIIVSELVTTSPFSPFKLIPMRVHIGLDVVTGLVLALSPWLFGFAQFGANVWVPHLIVGILVMGYALMTNTVDDTAKASAPHRA